MHVRVYIHRYGIMHASIHVCIYVRMHASMYASMYERMHLHHPCMHRCTNVCTKVCISVEMEYSSLISSCRRSDHHLMIRRDHIQYCSRCSPLVHTLQPLGSLPVARRYAMPARLGSYADVLYTVCMYVACI
jgi:hypothetical protein